MLPPDIVTTEPRLKVENIEDVEEILTNCAMDWEEEKVVVIFTLVLDFPSLDNCWFIVTRFSLKSDICPKCYRGTDFLRLKSIDLEEEMNTWARRPLL